MHQINSEAVAAGELLQHSLGWAAWKLHEAVVKLDDKEIRGFVDAGLQSPTVYLIGQVFDPYMVMMGSSPRFDMYGIEFRMGKAAAVAVAVRSGYANKFGGKVSSYEGREKGSMDS